MISLRKLIDKIKCNNPKYYTAFLIIFFGIYFIIGSNIYKDYGISTDEYFQMTNGYVNIKYIAEIFGIEEVVNHLYKVPDLNYYDDRDHGSSFEIILVGLEYLLDVDEVRNKFLLRHYSVFLTFFLSVIFFYFLIYCLYKNWYFSFLGDFFLILSPRIFAHSFYNTKDLIALCSVIFCSFTFFRLIDKKTYWNSVIPVSYTHLRAHET